MSSGLDRQMVRLQALLLLGMLAFQMLGRPAWASVLFTVTFPLSFGLWLRTVFRQINTCNLLVLLTFLTSCMAVMGNALMTRTPISLGYFKKLILFWSALAFFGASRAFSPGKRDRAILLGCNTAAACTFVGMYLLQRQEMFRLNGIVTGYLTFRFTNPNLTAAFLCAAAMLELIRGTVSRSLAGKVWHVLLGLMLAFFVFQTRSRNAQLTLGLFFLAWVYGNMRPGKPLRIGGLLAAGITAAPLLFALGYLLLVYHPAVQELFSFLRSEGKDLDSRVQIWRFALNSFLESPVLGAYSQISGGTGASQMHNSHLDILASYGIPVLGLVCLLFYLLLYQGRKNGGREAFLCRFAFGCLLLLGMGEAMLFSGGMGICLYGGIFLMLANFEEKGGASGYEADFSE
ncbi:MAG: O-antigen ligase family protein [Oscillospiraceae bacterium]|nr:O-antigen ligase family protein [Oscillospiraceae bacterium]